VHVFLPDGDAATPFPGPDVDMRQGSELAVGPDGSVHVASGAVVQSFSPDGGLLRRTELPLAEISSLAASPCGTLYALDAGRRRRLVGFDPSSGEVTITFDIPRTVRTPAAVAADGTGSVYLLDGRARTIFVLRPTPASE
jgi:hypothetical protein